jgi:glycosyltransferase involved in cell wall biosynthesis
MRVLFASLVWPTPWASGAGVRTTSLARLLRELSPNGSHLSVVSGAREGFGSQGSHAERVPFTWLRESGLVDDTIQCSPNDSAGVSHLLGQTQPDVVVFDTFAAEEQWGWSVRRHCPNAITVLDTQDLHSLRYARHEALKERLPFPVSPGEQERALSEIRSAVPDAVSSERFVRELSSVQRSDVAVVVSSFEEELLLESGVRREALVRAPFIFEDREVAERELLARSRGFSERRGFVTVGNWRHPPNADSVAWLSEEVWPKLRQKLGSHDAELSVFGAFSESDSASALHRPGGGFLMRGFAEDVLGPVAESRVMLAPLRFGAGVKTKIVDAWSVGTPVVGTSIAGEAMGDAGMVLSDSAEGMAEAAAAIYLDVGRWNRLHEESLAQFRRQYARSSELSGAAALLSAVSTAVADPETTRRRNVTGACLWRGTGRGLEYFSRWIELKESLREEGAKLTG